MQGLPLLRNRWLRSGVVAALAFGAFGTVSALWPNPIFMRMTPVGAGEIGVLAALSALLGLYVAIRRPACGNTAAGAGGVLAFLGIACPVCNKLLVLLVGGEALLTYFEPIRIYVAAAGAAILAAAVVREWHCQRPGKLTPAPGARATP